jgi:ribonuclease J
MKLIVHRGAHEVGGNCVEISTGHTTILIDVGLPLSFNFDDEIETVLPQPLFEGLRSGKKSVDGILLSHPHLDHYGLIAALPKGIPMYCGETAARLIRISRAMNPKIALPENLQTFEARDHLQIGDMIIRPYLMDHSAFDSYAFLVEANGTSIFYTGDFRGHGRKGKLLDRLVHDPPQVNILMTEGTRIIPDTSEMFTTEEELEEEFIDVIKKAEGLVFVTAPSQNIDRIVTIFKAAKRTGRKFIIDPYTAEVLDCLDRYPRIPKPSWPSILVAYSGPVIERLEQAGRTDILEKHRKNGIKWDRMNKHRNEFVILLRPSALGPVKKYLDISQAVWIYSMWPGYFEKSPSLQRLKKFFQDSGVTYKCIHTSGHAAMADIKKLVTALNPEIIIPIHSFHTEEFKKFFDNVRLVKDREVVEVQDVH